MNVKDRWEIQLPAFVRWLYPNSIFRQKTDKKVVYLTFDDGPIPEQTPWVLDLLDREGIKATFFCVGDNVRKYPELFADVVRRGHSVGNHTFNHVSLFKTSWRDYFTNIKLCNTIQGNRARLFRPPHGQMTPWRCLQLTRSLFYRVVFWDVMPKDYDKNLTPEAVYTNLVRFVRPGSVIVLHDSVKAGERMRYALEHGIEYLKAQGYEFSKL